MFCTNCGKAIPDGVSFCTGCGAAVREVLPADGFGTPEPSALAVPVARPNRVLLILSAVLVLLNPILSFWDIWKADDLLGVGALSAAVDSAPFTVLGELAEELPFLYVFLFMGAALVAAAVLFLLLPLWGKLPYSKVCLLPAAVMCALSLLFIVGFCGIVVFFMYNTGEYADYASLRLTASGFLLMADSLALPVVLGLLHRDIKQQSGGVRQ